MHDLGPRHLLGAHVSPSPSALQAAVSGERAAGNVSIKNAFAILADVLENDV